MVCMKTFFLLTALLFKAIVLSAQPHLRGLIVANTEDEYIGCVHDVATMKRSLEVIGKKIGFLVDLTVIKGKDFSTEHVVRELRRISEKSQDQDIVFFYYTGHGFHDSQTISRWPTLCTYRHSPGKPLAGRAIIKYLKKQPHRLALILFDCCNIAGSCKRIITHIETKGLPLQEEMNLPGLEQLFLKTKGLVIGAGASVGEYGYARKDGGGCFTNGLINVLSSKCQSATTWNEISNETCSFTHTSTSGRQHSVFVVR